MIHRHVPLTFRFLILPVIGTAGNPLGTHDHTGEEKGREEEDPLKLNANGTATVGKFESCERRERVYDSHSILSILFFPFHEVLNEVE